MNIPGVVGNGGGTTRRGEYRETLTSLDCPHTAQGSSKPEARVPQFDHCPEGPDAVGTGDWSAGHIQQGQGHPHKPSHRSGRCSEMCRTCTGAPRPRLWEAPSTAGSRNGLLEKFIWASYLLPFLGRTEQPDPARAGHRIQSPLEHMTRSI